MVLSLAGQSLHLRLLSRGTAWHRGQQHLPMPMTCSTLSPWLPGPQHEAIGLALGSFPPLADPQG